MKPAPTEAPIERLSSSGERVKSHSEESGFCVLRVKVKGPRDLVTVVGSANSITPASSSNASAPGTTTRV